MFITGSDPNASFPKGSSRPFPNPKTYLGDRSRSKGTDWPELFHARHLTSMAELVSEDARALGGDFCISASWIFRVFRSDRESVLGKVLSLSSLSRFFHKLYFEFRQKSQLLHCSEMVRSPPRESRPCF